ncbi:MAG: M48 family metallopeptidase [Cytophagaceae bacterium]
MPYIGIQAQIKKNNFYSGLMLILFPILLMIVGAFITQSGEGMFLFLLLSLIWFVIAFFTNNQLINISTGAKPLSRKENPRVYNLLENLCISQGITMPKLQIIHDPSLNAYASGIRSSDYTITVSEGLINKLNDEELEGVLAHELCHIIHRDVRLLIVSVIFVGIFAFIAEMAMRMMRFGRGDKKNNQLLLIAIAVSALAYFISILLRFGISRKREYMADAGAAEITKRPEALASALRKVSEDPLIEAVESRDVAQLFIHNPKPSLLEHSWDNIFSTHPPIEKRIQLLEQFL